MTLQEAEQVAALKAERDRFKHDRDCYRAALLEIVDMFASDTGKSLAGVQTEWMARRVLRMEKRK